MSGFENYVGDMMAMELEIERKGIVLGVDWTNEVQVRALAREALDHKVADIHLSTAQQVDPLQMAKINLFGLAGLMLKTMQESAEEGFLSHGGDAWKAFARALWAESRMRGSSEGKN